MTVGTIDTAAIVVVDAARRIGKIRVVDPGRTRRKKFPIPSKV